MKRLLCIIISLLLLTGCGGEVQETNPPETSLIPAEPPVSWVEELGEPWDAEGALVELPVNISNALTYTVFMPFDGDLMLWRQDNHRQDLVVLDICIFDLDTGEVVAQRDIPLSAPMAPQVLGDVLYVFDRDTGNILKLDKQLNQVQQWQTDIREASVYLDANGTAYVTKWDEPSYALNLETGEKRPILEENPDIYYLEARDGFLRVEYYHPDTGESCAAFLDLYTGERHDIPIPGITNAEFRNGTWLLQEFEDSYVYTLMPTDAEAVMVNSGYASLGFLETDRLLMTSESNNQLSIYDLSGKALAQCIISEREFGFESFQVIPNEMLGGYFVVVSNHGGGMHLLFWDTARGERGEDIVFEPVPTPSEQENRIRTQISRLETQYGLNILVGSEADAFFYDFEAEVVLDLGDIQKALDVLEDALEDYPEGFFRQLRYSDVKRTDIHLMGTITATNSEYTDTYAAFVQDGYDGHVMVMDIYQADVSTYYHEFSHIIDSFLEWDAMNRDNALFSDDTWCSLNPGWFPGYTYSYSWEQYVEDYSCFVDDYSTINPTEDRARVMEYAMVDYGYYTFEDADVLLEKLSYYCRCIRDAFDTSGWPDTVLWEQYLP